MAYKTLYRVYRPQRFEDVAGQEHIVTTLKHAIEENRIAHAYLFCGPRGTGKTTVAKLLAKAINCTSQNRPCGECLNCKAIENNNHPDVIEIDAASNNGVAEARELIEKVKFAPTTGKYKVYIIDEVHMMSNEAFNALLKTLEEPPEHVVFILATTEPQKVLPTIISRCQRFDFTKLSLKDICDRLRTVIEKEHCHVDEDAIEMIAKLADGGMRDALSILEQCLAYNDQHLSIDDVNHIYGVVSMENKINFLKILLTKDMKRSLSLLEEMTQSGVDIKRLTYDLVDILKDVIIYKNTKDYDILFVLSSYDIEQISPYISVEEAFSLIDILMDASEKYSKSNDPSIYFELAVIKMCNHIEKEEVQSLPQINNVETLNTETHRSMNSEGNEKNTDNKKDIKEDNEVINDVNNEEEIIDQSDDYEEYVEEEIPTFEFEQEKQIESTSDQIEVSMDDIMNILVQARREILNDIIEKWTVIKRYMANINTAKCASMLCNGTPVAACKGGLIISFEFMPDVNAVNYYKNYQQLSLFIKEILGEEYKFIAVQKDEWPKIRNRYIELRRRNELPSPQPITLQHIDKYDLNKKNLNQAQQYAVDMFGDIVEFEEE